MNGWMDRAILTGSAAIKSACSRAWPTTCCCARSFCVLIRGDGLFGGVGERGPVAAEIATDVLIIEDEGLIAQDIQFICEDLGHRVIGVARTHGEALELAKTRRPGLILADIQLADGSSGLDAVDDLLNTFEVPVIFITAYPERFLTGERPEPAFLIAKPFQPSTVSAEIGREHV